MDLGYILDSDEEAISVSCSSPDADAPVVDVDCVTEAASGGSRTVAEVNDDNFFPVHDSGGSPCKKQKCSKNDSNECHLEDERDEMTDEPVSKQSDFEGYALRDLRNILKATLPRYSHVLSDEEKRSLKAFETLSLRAQQLYARLLWRKWPQWIPLEGLGARYSELGVDETQLAVGNLMAANGNKAPEFRGVAPGSIQQDFSPPAWLWDSSSADAVEIMSCKLHSGSTHTYGSLLLSALPISELRLFSRKLGVDNNLTIGKQLSKQMLVAKLLESAQKQTVLLSRSSNLLEIDTFAQRKGEVQLVAQAIKTGRWVCLSDTPGRTAFVTLGELFKLEKSGVPDSNFMIFSSRWPDYGFDALEAVPPLFHERSTLDSYLGARRMIDRLEMVQDRSSLDLQNDSVMAEGELLKALKALNRGSSQFELAKSQHPFHCRFTVAWCWAEALHHCVMYAPAVGDDREARQMKIQRLRLLLECGLCISRRARWYNELAKELAREDLVQALEVASTGLAEGEWPPLSATVEVDLTDIAASQEADASSVCSARPSRAETSAFPVLPTDSRWELARRCKALASKLAVKSGKKSRSANAWHAALRNTQAAREKFQGSNDRGNWLVRLVLRLLAEEDSAVRPPQCISAEMFGLPQMTSKKSGGRRMFDGMDLEELNVEELAMRYYFSADGGSFDFGIHCEGGVLRDLFGLLMFDQLFDKTVRGCFTSAYQDAPLDLGTEAFYLSRKVSIDKRLLDLSQMTPWELAREVRSLFAKLSKIRIRGVRWERYEGNGCAFVGRVNKQREDSLAVASPFQRRVLIRRSQVPSDLEGPDQDYDLGAAAGSIGGAALAAACRLLCEDYNSSGLPDLLLWSWNGGSSPRAMFVEVKSERDTLSRRQRLWLAILRNAGAEAEVCHVRDGPIHPKKRAGSEDD